MVAAISSSVSGRKRIHSQAERIADGFVHGLGLIAGLAGGAFLVVLTLLQGNANKLSAILVYALGLLAMLGASAAYNIFYGTKFREVFRRCDHSAIFIMIAGTYTPFTTQFFGQGHAILFTGAIWTLSLGGIAMKIWRPAWFERSSVFLYLLLGWIAVLILGPLLVSLPLFAASSLVIGGLLYTFGVTFHLWEKLPFQNAIWHMFVLCAAVCHYFAVLDGVVLRGTMV